MWSIGLDYHTNLSVICVLYENGKTILSKTIHGRMEIVMEELRKIKHPSRLKALKLLNVDL